MTPAISQSTPVKVNANEHVQNYLNFYLSFPHAPHYAVLLNGAWGIGKTFLMRKVLDEYFKKVNEAIDIQNKATKDNKHKVKNEKYVYVSLYGLKTAQDVDRALMAEMFPVLNNKVMLFGAKLAKAAFSTLGEMPDFEASDYVSKFRGSVYVFDDLERCALPVQEVMGYINEFVEHQGLKVIILAYEQEIGNSVNEKADYSSRREKTIGKVLEIQSSIDEAYAFFVSKVADSGSRHYLTKNADKVISIFKASKLENLRILQQSLWDFERLYTCISNKKKSKTDSIDILSHMFLALSLEVKSGKIKEDEFTNRQQNIFKGILGKDAASAKPSGFGLATMKYSSIDFNDTILSDSVLKNLLFKGVFREDEIDASMSASYHYQEPGEEPSWRTVWFLSERTNDEVSDALETMQKEFDSRKFSIFGEVLQVFGLRLWASSNGLLELSGREVVDSCKTYIDDLYEAGRLGIQIDHAFGLMTGYDGLEMYEKTTPEFDELYQHFRLMNQKGVSDQYPVWGKILLDEILADDRTYVDKLTRSLRPPEGFYMVPVLAEINPAEFVDVLFSLEPSAQKYVFMALSGRYENSALNDRLSAEKNWLKEVHSLIHKKLADENLIVKVRFKLFMGWGMNGWAALPATNAH
jgi:hypothetical protein